MRGASFVCRKKSSFEPKPQQSGFSLESSPPRSEPRAVATEATTETGGSVRLLKLRSASSRVGADDLSDFAKYQAHRRRVD